MRKLLAAAMAIFAMLTAANGEDAKPIRDFDVAMLEKLGQHIYRQDQLAWKATDLAFAKLSAEQLKAGKGWIVDEERGHDVVRFLRDGANGVEAAFDVTFEGDAAPVLSEPQNRALTAEDLAQYNARQLAAEKFDFHCTEDAPNTVAFRDPQKDGWLVYVLTATKDTKAVVLAGHMRFTISRNGNTVLQADKLSRGCLVNKQEELKTGEELSGLMVSTVVSLKPVETLVFAALSYKRPVYTMTPDGVAWKTADGKIATVDMDMPGLDGYSARIMAGYSETCMMLFEFNENGRHFFKFNGSAQVIMETETAERYAPKIKEGQKLAAVQCLRRDIVPAPNDYKVPLAGYDLYIMSGFRIGILKLKDGRFTWDMQMGGTEWSEDRRISRRLDAFNKAIAKKP